MVFADRNYIQFGNGDVSIMLSMTGAKASPQAMVIFQNREPTVITPIAEDADMSLTGYGIYNQREDIAMMFSKPESIDCVISALQAVKRATFGEDRPTMGNT